MIKLAEFLSPKWFWYFFQKKYEEKQIKNNYFANEIKWIKSHNESPRY